MSSKAAIWVLLVMLVCGCMGPRPAAPAAALVSAPPSWRDASGQGVAIGRNWWTAFGDSVLTDHVETALANNMDIAIAASRVEEARAEERLAHAQLLPTLDAGASGGRQRAVSAFGEPQVQTFGVPDVAAAYDLDLFGRLANSDKAAQASLLATRFGSDVIRLAVASSTVGGYITLRELDARLSIAQSTLADRAKAQSFARRRAEAGYTSLLEMRQAEAEYKATEQLIPQIEIAIARQENALQVLMGGVPGPVTRGLPLASLRLPGTPQGLPAQLLRRRPDIAEAEQTLVAADHNLDSARAAFLPNIQLSGSTGSVFSTLLSGPISIWSVGGSILAPIFEGGRLTAQSNASAARRDQAAFAYRKATLIAFREVEDGLASSQKSAEELEIVRAQRTALALSLRLATNRYNAGYAPYIDQLDAQRGLLSADLGVVQSEADSLTALVRLYAAMGGGWTAPLKQ